MTDYERWCLAYDNARSCGTSADAEYLNLLIEERRQEEESRRGMPAVRKAPKGRKAGKSGFITFLQVFGILAWAALAVYLLFFM